MRGGVGFNRGGDGEGNQVLDEDYWRACGEREGVDNVGREEEGADGGNPGVCTAAAAGDLRCGHEGGAVGEVGEEGWVLFEQRVGTGDGFAVEEEGAELRGGGAAEGAEVGKGGVEGGVVEVRGGAGRGERVGVQDDVLRDGVWVQGVGGSQGFGQLSCRKGLV